MYSDTKVVVIGMGFLATYLKSCMVHLVGENLPHNFIGVNTNPQRAQQKTQEMGFPVVAGGHAEVLRRHKPDLILLAPVPTAVKGLCEEVLAPYYSELRAAGQPLPDLYSFAPNPVGQYFVDTLGADVCAVTVLPNMISEVHGKDLSQQCYNVCVFPENAPWPAEKLKRMETFFIPTGYNLVVPEKHAITMLGGFLGGHCLQLVALAAWEGAAKTRPGLTHQQVASSMRFSVLRQNGKTPGGPVPCSESDVDAELAQALAQAAKEWMDGIQRCNRKLGIDETLGMEIALPQADVFLAFSQLCGIEEINEENAGNATEGGLMERALEFYASDIREKLTAWFAPGTLPLPGEAYTFIEEMGMRLSEEVAIRGSQLADGSR